MRRPRPTSYAGALLIAAALLVATSCATVAVSGRKQLNLVPDSEMLSMSNQQYAQFLQENKKGTDATQNAMVERVGKRIQAAVEGYAKETNRTADLEGYAWEFNVVESDQVNAWCMPGGKVVFYTGILPVCQDENGIAVVMGHEVAHAVARHGSERMSQQLLLQMGGSALSAAVKTHPQETQQLWMGAFGAGAQYGVMLPFGRAQESEADRLGLVFMARAGYDPSHAVTFWQRMSQAGGEKPPEFMSTHPSDEARIKKIKEELPEAMKQYQRP